MADKLTDKELAEEFRRFNEEIKIPVDSKRRSILIKKLNHYRARENPPPKRSRSGGRRSQKPVAPVEFSDDSQDEADNARRQPSRKATTASASPSYTNTRRSTRDRRSTNPRPDASSSGVQTLEQNRGTPRGKNKRLSEVKQLELYANEFSDTDNDTENESVYEVENKSINTTFNLDNTFDEGDDSFLMTSQTRNRPARTGVAVTPNYTNHVNSGVTVKKDKNNTNHNELSFKENREQSVSKTILVILAVFFVVLALSYAWVRRDLFLPVETSLQTGLNETMKFCADTEKGERKCEQFKKEEVVEGLSVIRKLHDRLSKLKGQMEVGEIEADRSRLNKEQVKKMVAKTVTADRILDLIVRLLLQHPEWDVRVLQDDLSPAEVVSDGAVFEAVLADLPFTTRVWLAVYKVLYGLFLLLCCVFLGVLGIFYLRWQNKRKEVEQRKVYEMVEKIIELLKENSELAERKNDPVNYPAYIAVQHIRDQLIPVAKRKQLQPLWDESVKFIEANESRIRVETQVIQGEEFTVWRWIQTFPNGGRMWQGQAFGEGSQGSINTLPYGPTPCLKVRNMFDANMEQVDGDWHVDIEDAILEKCKSSDGILHIFVDTASKEGCVYIKCSSCEKAFEVYSCLHGWWFDGQLVTVKYLRLEHYHDRFPDSRNRRHPLKPSTNTMHSMSRPYYKSALEMT